MFNIRAFSIGKGHEEAIKTILKHGCCLLTEDGEKTIELPEPLNIHVRDPFEEYMISPYNMFGEGAMKQYVHDLLHGTESEFAYTYHDRLFDHPVKDGENYLGDGDKKGIDQIEYIVQKLKEEPNSRRALGITWFPPKDTKSGNPPCLQRIQCLLRDNNLNMHVEFRSNDMLSALGANMYALVNLQKMIAERLDAGTGWYSHTSVSAHIYHERDYEELSRYIRGLGLKDIPEKMK
ncbi:thymidylate synthase [Methanoplanus limicola]|uniref:Putative thymidylate synthase n=1 Tax=Methanoplanus limicola DSM 2279 TaxID=937775 RepID=H1YYF4_9EURY|nr:thymidylate synthase [Methanoplanus limicola]EHQ35052.1 thymidylate synthase [Methanoplanus limicola DSM 2279]